MNPKLWLAGRAVGVGGHFVAEKALRRKARAAGDIPGSAGAITEEWLTAVLSRGVPGAEVTGFSTPGGSAGTTTRVALRLAYNDAGTRAGLPTELFAKLSASYTQRVTLGSIDVQRGEADFFNEMRPLIEIEAPRGYWSAFDERSWRSVILMDDIVATRGATFIEPMTPVTRAQVEDLLENMARYHGALWESPELAILKTPRQFLENVSAFVSMGERGKVGMERAKSVISPGVYGEAGKLWEGTRRALAAASDDMPRTLLHGDSHIGQTYVTADGRMGLTDWQAAQQGGWGYDFAYLVASACEPDDRRAWETELLELYLERLGEHGGEPPALADARLIYRQQLFYPYSAWAFTIGRAAYQPKMQPDDVCLAILRRLSAAIDENDSFAAIGL